MKSLFLSQAARMLGGDVIGPNSILCPGYGHSLRDRSLHVSFHSDGSFGCHSYAGDDWKTCREHVRKLLGASEQWPRPESCGAVPLIVHRTGGADKAALAMRLWDQCEPPGPVVKAYLKSRDLELPVGMEDGDVIRYNGSCPMRLEDGSRAYLPAMVCLFRDVLTDEPKAVHRIALEPDGCGKSRRFSDPSKVRQMCGPVLGCAIKLSPDADVSTGLAISEGVENAIAAMCGALRPVWALATAGGIKGFPVLPAIECLKYGR
jgi:hypothetical protein